MTTERRLQPIEETLRMLTELNQSVVAMLASHEEQLASLRETTNRLTEANGRLTEIVHEAREDNRMTRNLWVRLARRYGWLEDDDFQE